MTLIKTSILSAIATIIRITSGFIITKVIAVYIGSSGLAVIGQLQNFINLVTLVSGNFLRTAITKYTAEYKNEDIKKHEIWSTSIKVAFGLNIVIFILLFFCSENISNYLFKDDEYSYLLKILSISLPGFVLNTILLSILNGQKQIKKYISLNILLSIVSLILVIVLSISYGLDGALLAYIINQSVVFIITIFYLRNESWLKVKFFICKIKFESIKKLFGFAMITFAAIVSSNFAMIYIRNYISETISLSSAGCWQGIWVLSQASLSLITTSLSTYFLPTLSELKDKKEITKELTKAIYIILPIVIAISFMMYLLRVFIVQILYTNEFMPMSELFLWQMIGNVIKVCGWLFGYILVAKAMVKYTVSTEIIFATTWILLTIYLVNLYGLVGVTYSYAVNSFLHFITMCYIYKVKLY
jgi:O-antigen/teichoic acid export membrane protein